MADNADIILAAMNMTGSKADNPNYEVDLARNAVDIKMMMGENSPMMKRLNEIDNVTKVFRGVLVGIKRESSSTRGLVTINSGTTQEHQGLPAGHEQARTGRTDSDDYTRDFCNRLRELIGHNCLFFIEMEKDTKGSGREYRILRYVQDLGKAE